MLVVGIGGTLRDSSTSAVALTTALAAAERAGLETRAFTASELQLPLYDPGRTRQRPPAVVALVETIREASALIISSPGYHGTVSGLVKNALDYVEDLASDDRPYLSGLPVGCIAVAHGWQAAVNTLRALRDIVHSVRGWPTPYGAAVNVQDPVMVNGDWSPAIRRNLELVGDQVAEFLLRTWRSPRPG